MPDGDSRLKTCPFCAEQIQAAARLCKHCRATFDEQGTAHAPGAAGPAPGQPQYGQPQYGQPPVPWPGFSGPPSRPKVGGQGLWVAAACTAGAALLLLTLQLLFDRSDFLSGRRALTLLAMTVVIVAASVAQRRHWARPAFAAAALVLAVSGFGVVGPTIGYGFAAVVELLTGVLLLATAVLGVLVLRPALHRRRPELPQALAAVALALYVPTQFLSTVRIGSDGDAFGLGGVDLTELEAVDVVRSLLSLIVLLVPALLVLLLERWPLAGFIGGWLAIVLPFELARLTDYGSDSSFSGEVSPASGLYLRLALCLVAIVALALAVRVARASSAAATPADQALGGGASAVPDPPDRP
jgi:hypothetical protein